MSWVSGSLQQVLFEEADPLAWETINCTENWAKNLIKSSFGHLLKKESLDRRDSTVICQAIVRHLAETSTEMRISYEKLEEWAEYLGELFPKLGKTYFFRFTRILQRNKKATSSYTREAAGDLFIAYKNIRQKLIREGLLAARKQTKTNPPRPVGRPRKSIIESVPYEKTLSADILTVLNNENANMEEIKLAWSKTFYYRRAEKDSFQELYSKFKLLRNKDIATLLLKQDFMKQAKSGNKINTLNERLPVLKEALKKYICDSLSAKKGLGKKEKILDLLKHLDSENKQESDGAFLSLLPYALKVTGFVAAGKPCVKEESFKNFILHETDLAEAMRKIDIRKGANEETLEPLVVAVGPTIYKLSNVHALIDGELYYSFPTLIEAVEFVLYVHYSFNLNYRSQCKNIWLLIEKLFFDVGTLDETKSQSVFQTVNSIQDLILTSELNIIDIVKEELF